MNADGTLPASAQNMGTAAKGATAAGSPTSTAASADRQPLDVTLRDTAGNAVVVPGAVTSPTVSGTTAVGAAAPNPVSVGGADGAGNLRAMSVDATTREQAVNVAARTAFKNSEVCATNGAGGTSISALTGRKALALQNLGPNAVFCTFDGQSPTADGKLGWKLDAAGGVFSTFFANVGDASTVKCIAATAAQSTGACLQVVEMQ